MKRQDQKVASGGEVARRAYMSPEVVSMTSTDLLELLGPAHGYGGTPGTGGGSSVSDTPGMGYRKG